jgi:hypothetical protein
MVLLHDRLARDRLLVEDRSTIAIAPTSSTAKPATTAAMLRKSNICAMFVSRRISLKALPATLAQDQLGGQATLSNDLKTRSFQDKGQSFEVTKLR